MIALSRFSFKWTPLAVTLLCKRGSKTLNTMPLPSNLLHLHRSMVAIWRICALMRLCLSRSHFVCSAFTLLPCRSSPDRRASTLRLPAATFPSFCHSPFPRSSSPPHFSRLQSLAPSPRWPELFEWIFIHGCLWSCSQDKSAPAVLLHQRKTFLYSLKDRNWSVIWSSSECVWTVRVYTGPYTTARKNPRRFSKRSRVQMELVCLGRLLNLFLNIFKHYLGLSRTDIDGMCKRNAP